MKGNMPEFKELIDALAHELGREEFALSEDGDRCMIGFDTVDVSISYKKDSGIVLLFSIISDPPQNNMNLLYSRLLDANTYFIETQGFTLGGGACPGITLQGYANIEALDAEKFVNFISNFVDAAIKWQGVCNEYESASSLPNVNIPQENAIKI